MSLNGSDFPGTAGGVRGVASAGTLLLMVTLLILASLLTGIGAVPVAGAEPLRGPTAHVVPISGEIDSGLAALVQQAVRRAEADPDARAIVLVVETLGGQVQSALDIRDALLRSRLTTVAVVRNRAISAGALISLAAEKLYMARASQIGDAQPLPMTDKTVAFVRGEFAATAQARGRNVQIAEAMVDKNVQIPGLTTGLPLVLTWQKAVEHKIADGEAGSADEALRLAGLGEARQVQREITPSEAAGRFLTQSWVSVLLLVIGITGLAIEFMKPGLTLPGLVGVTALAAFVGGHWLIGTAGWLEVGMILLGAAFLIVEAVVPGFGVFGIGGLVLFVIGIFLMVPSPVHAAWYLSISGVGAIVLLGLVVRQISRTGMGRWLTLQQRIDDGSGAVPARVDLVELVGHKGLTVTPLRPAGIAEVAGRRLDVVTQGEFVPAQTAVIVLQVDGTHVVVKAAARD